MLIGEFLNSSNVLLIQLNLLEVLRNPRWRDRLGDDRVATDLAPSQNDLRRRSALLLSNSLDLWARDEEWDVEEVVAKGRVGGDVNVLLLRVGDELLAGKDRVPFNLKGTGHDIGFLDQGLQGLVREVGHTNRADLALGQLAHGLPCVADGSRGINVHFIRVRSGREEVRVRVLARAEVDGPVNEVEIEVFELELGERVVKRGLDMGGVVLRVPELRGDEDVFTLEAGDVGEGTLDALRDLFLVLVAVIGGTIVSEQFWVKVLWRKAIAPSSVPTTEGQSSSTSTNIAMPCCGSSGKNFDRVEHALRDRIRTSSRDPVTESNVSYLLLTQQDLMELAGSGARKLYCEWEMSLHTQLTYKVSVSDL